MFESKRAKPLLGTLVDIRIRCESEASGRAGLAAAFAEVAEIHALMSFHEAGSDVDRLNCALPGEWVSVDARTAEVLACAQALHLASDGAFDVQVVGLLVECGLLPRMPAGAGPGPPARGASKARRGLHRIDLGGIAKGYAVDAAVAVLRQHGVESGLVNAGGDLRCFGPVPATIQLRDPADPRRIASSVELRDRALASSASRGLSAWQGVSALIDPLRGAALPEGAGASVTAPNCMLADGLTKVVLVTGDPRHPALALHGALTVLHRCGTPA